MTPRVLCRFLFVLALLLSGAHGAAAQSEVSLDELEHTSYMWSRDREYISYIEALDLTPETKDALWQHLTRKYEQEEALETLAAAELGDGYADEADLLVITYDQDSEYFRRREEWRQAADKELRSILTEKELAEHQHYREFKELERSKRKLRRQIEDMELDLTPLQFEVALEVFEKKPAFFQEPPTVRGAAGYSTGYMQERERWRFNQEQDYLEAKLIPILNPDQVKRFRTWKEVQRIELNRSLELYRTSEAFMDRLYPERRRRVRMLSTTPTAERPEKRPVYIECRNHQLFRIPVAEIQKRVTETLKEIAERTKGSPRTLMQELARSRVETDAYRVDLTYALLAQLALRPRQGTRGYPLTDIRAEQSTDWYGRILAGLDPKTEKLTFVVRDDSTEVFERARTLAEAKKIPYAYELVDPVAPIKFGLGGVPAIITNHPVERRSVPLNIDEAKTPSYIDVYRDRVVLYPGRKEVRARDLDGENNDLARLLDEVEAHREKQYIVLLIRPRSAILANRLTHMIQERGIRVAQQFYEEGQAAGQDG